MSEQLVRMKKAIGTTVRAAAQQAWTSEEPDVRVETFLVFHGGIIYKVKRMLRLSQWRSAESDLWQMGLPLSLEGLWLMLFHSALGTQNQFVAFVGRLESAVDSMINSLQKRPR